MGETPEASRRRILRSVGASSITLGGIGISSDPVAADEQSTLQVERLSGYRAKYIASVARFSREYRSLVNELDLGAAPDLESEVFEKNYRVRYDVHCLVHKYWEIATGRIRIG